MAWILARLHGWPFPPAVAAGVLLLATGLALMLVFVAQNGDNLTYRGASPCPKGSPPSGDCIALLSGRIAAISVTRYEDVTGGSTTVSLTLDLPGRALVAVLPQSRLSPVVPR